MTTNQSTAMVIRSQAVEPFEPQDLTQARQLAEDISQSVLLPPALRGKVYDVYVTIMWGRDLGLSPMQSVFGIWIEPRSGRPGLYEQTAIALVQRSPFCKYIRCIHSDGVKAVWETQRNGHPDPDKASFTLDEAKQAGLLGKDNWKSYPADMLRARAAFRLARQVYPDVLANVYSPDELLEIREREMVDVTPTIVAPPPPPPPPPAPRGTGPSPMGQRMLEEEERRQGGKNTSRPEPAPNSPADIGFTSRPGKPTATSDKPTQPMRAAAATPSASPPTEGTSGAAAAHSPSPKTEPDRMPAPMTAAKEMPSGALPPPAGTFADLEEEPLDAAKKIEADLALEMLSCDTQPELDAVVSKAKKLKQAGKLGAENIDRLRSVLAQHTADIRDGKLDPPKMPKAEAPAQ